MRGSRAGRCCRAPGSRRALPARLRERHVRHARGGTARALRAGATEPKWRSKMDLVYLALSAGLFALFWGLIVACELLALEPGDVADVPDWKRRYACLVRVSLR